MQRTLRGARIDAVVTNPPLSMKRDSGKRRTSIDRKGRCRARTPNIYSEHCEALWEILPPHGELIAISPSSWLTGRDYSLFRDRLRAETDLTDVIRWNNHHTLWGRTGVAIHTTAWRCRRRAPEERRTRAETESALTVTTYADQEKYARWSHSVPPPAKWTRRCRGARLEWSVTTDEDGMAARLTEWRERQPRLEDIGLDIQCGPHSERRDPGAIRTEAESGPRRTPYVGTAHVQRRKLGLAPEDRNDRASARPHGWLIGSNPRYLRAAIWSQTNQPIDGQIRQLTRGRLVYIEGRIQTAYRRDDNGTEIEVKRIMATKVRILPETRHVEDEPADE